MKQKIFTEQEREELLCNPRILDVKNSHVIFTQNFKDFALLEHYVEGKTCKDVFQQAGIPDWLNTNKYAISNLKRWKRQSKQESKPIRGRPKKQSKPNSELTYEELQAKIAYLEEENEFLKKLEALEQ